MDTKLSENVLLLFAKKPRAGSVKTRLIPVLGARRASQLYQAFLVDMAQYILKIKNCCTPVLCYWPPESGAAMQRLIPEGFVFKAQEGNDFGERLSRAIQWAFLSGAKRVVVLGSDSPTVDLDIIKKAMSLLKKRDVVLGPSADGGYYILGLRSFRPELFSGIPWSTDCVFDSTLRVIAFLNLSLGLLPLWYDVDTPASLDFLKSHLLGLKLSGAYLPENTSQLLSIWDKCQPPVK